ncbi:MAG: flavin reductase family protein [Thermoleophilia bacterium]|nr:flavin reductase family protein [Thermoleophilia bacterium]
MAVPDPQEFRQVVGLLPTGVTVVTAFTPDGPAGATASAVCSLSLTPMMMLVCLDRGSRTLPAVESAGRFGINVLGLDQRAAAEIFATKAPLPEKWESVEWRSHLDVPVIKGCPAHIVCGLHEVIDGGDHVILTGDVIEVEAEPGEPLVYHGGLFRRLDPENP